MCHSPSLEAQCAWETDCPVLLAFSPTAGNIVQLVECLLSIRGPSAVSPCCDSPVILAHGRVEAGGSEDQESLFEANLKYIRS